MEYDKNARIMRNLCIMRESIIRDYGKIKQQIEEQHKPIANITEFPFAAMTDLEKEGIYLFDSRHNLVNYLIKINRIIGERIGNIKYLFPDWVRWPYIQDLLTMPHGLSANGIYDAIGVYNIHRGWYPYQTYINWKSKDVGNLFLHDKRFLETLYEQHYEKFTETSRVQDISEDERSSFKDFILKSDGVVFFVDCENADPYVFSTTLRDMPDDVVAKIRKILLCDDVHSSNAWQMLEARTRIPVERILTERVLDHKSIVDMKLTTEIFKAFYQDHITSFVLSASDSDYFTLIESLPDAKFFVLLERSKTSPELKRRLSDKGVAYCNADEFFSGNDDQLKMAALLREMRAFVASHVSFNVNDMLAQAQLRARTTLTTAEKDAFFQKWIKPMHLTIGDDGNVNIVFGKA